MKNLLKIFCAALALGVLFSAPRCPGAGKPRVVVTASPVYDWVREILGGDAGRFDLTLLGGAGADLHSYQPTAADMVRLAGADLFICLGGVTDAALPSSISGAVNSRMEVLELTAALGGAGGHAQREGEEHDHDGADEHVWLSLRDARALCALISEKLCALDPERADACRARATAYAAQLDSLDAEFSDMVSRAKRRTVIFADRFPFAALCRDYGLECFAAFSGCTADGEASFRTVAFLASKLRGLNLPALLTIENSDGRIAEAVRSAAGMPECEILAMDSMQSGEPRRYLDAMRGNLETLRRALN